MFAKGWLLSVALSCVAALGAAALAEPFEFVHEASRHNNLLPVWLEFQHREREYLANDEFKQKYVAARSWVNTYLGEYRAALGVGEPMAGEEDPESKNYRPVDAVEAIAAAARDRRVVMINEDHRDSSHRAFTTELLPVLRKQGFRYLAAEAFGPDVEAARYPKVGRDFTDDPVFGDMVRRALELGYTLVPYEAPSECSAAELKAFNTNGSAAILGNNCMEGRELGQARNLARFIESHPGEKLLVHVGGSRNAKIDFIFGKLMGLNFRELTKIDPLSIDQIQMSEGAGARPEYWAVAAQYSDRTAAFALQSKKGFYPEDDGMDISVMHPHAKYENGRPVWLSTGGWRKAAPIGQLPAYRAAAPEIRKAGTVILQVFGVNDSADAVPIDQFLITDPSKPAAVMAPLGKYRVRVIDREGRVLVGFEIGVS